MGRWRCALPWGLASLVALAVMLPPFAPLLHGDSGALVRDYGGIFVDMMFTQRAALLDGQPLLWDPIQYGGTPCWPLPNQASGYLPLWACVALLGPVRGLNACVLLHVLFGALGAFALTRRLGGAPVAGMVAGLAFVTAYYTQFNSYVLPLETVAQSFGPWILLLLLRGLEGGAAWLRAGVLAGVCQAATTWGGGYVALLPGMVMTGTVLAAAALRRPQRASLGRAVAMLAVFGAVYALLAAARLLPTVDWMALTTRAAGVSETAAVENPLDARLMLEWFRRDGVVVSVLAALAVAVALARVRRGAGASALWLAAGAVALLLLCEGSLHRFLYHHVPGFSHIREPRRAWLAMTAVLPALAGLGAAALLAPFVRRPLLGAAAGIVLVGAVAVENVRWPGFQLEPEIDVLSLSERIENNALHRHLAECAAAESRFRVHDFHDTRAQLKRTADLVRAALGLESIEGVLGNISIPAYDHDYIEASRGSRARLWGLMNVRYVTSNVPLDEPGLEFVAEFARDPNPIHEGTDGPFLYRNERELPRAFLVENAVLLVGADRLALGYWLSNPTWDPRAAAMVHLGYAEAAALEDDLLRRFAAVLLYEKQRTAAAFSALRDRLADLGVPAWDMAAPQGAAVAINRILSRFQPSLRAVADPPRDWNRIALDLPAPESGWIVLAETCAIYPGWTAAMDGRPVPLLRGNGAASVLPATGARRLELAYMPPRLPLGLALTALGAVACCLTLALTGRKRRRRSLAPADPPPAAPPPAALLPVP